MEVKKGKIVLRLNLSLCFDILINSYLHGEQEVLLAHTSRLIIL